MDTHACIRKIDKEWGKEGYYIQQKKKSENKDANLFPCFLLFWLEMIVTKSVVMGI